MENSSIQMLMVIGRYLIISKDGKGMKLKLDEDLFIILIGDLKFVNWIAIKTQKLLNHFNLANYTN